MTSKARRRRAPARAVEPFYFRLGERIAHVRNEFGVTQRQLGKALSPPLTRAGVSNIESAKQRCMAHTLTQIAAALRIKVSDLTDGLTDPLPKADLEIVDDRITGMLVTEGFLVPDGESYLVTPRGVSGGLGPRSETGRFPAKPATAAPASVLRPAGRSLQPQPTVVRARVSKIEVKSSSSKRRMSAAPSRRHASADE